MPLEQGINYGHPGEAHFSDFKRWIVEVTLFVLGLIAAIPLSVGGNLLQPRVEQALALRSSRRSAERVTRVTGEVTAAERMHEDRRLLLEYLIAQGLRATLYGSVGGIVTAAFFAIQQGASVIDSFRISPLINGFGLVGQVVGIVTAVLIISVCLRALRTLSNVQNYDAYMQTVDRQLGALQTSARRQESVQVADGPDVRPKSRKKSRKKKSKQR
ncbi:MULTISPECIES: hypothetical protein [unclassified Frondihabitans]|uniref:hypothetical protein n=1 Tax=unclassified Frondihabitans TaxID=2626248 RepID=UPI000F4DB254|nr:MULTISPECIES: hypothetical protein [unclassified Frondihabitans]